MEQLYFCSGGQIKRVYDDFIGLVVKKFPFSQWDLTTVAKKHVQKLSANCSSSNSQSESIPYSQHTTTEQKLIDFLTLIFKEIMNNPKVFDWSTDRIGTFLAMIGPSLKECLKSTNSETMYAEYLSKLHQMFAIPGTTVSVLNHIEILVSKSFNNLRFSAITKSMKNCLGLFKDQTDFGQIFPCSNISQYEDCQDYCKSHKDFISKFNSDELLTLIKFGMNQRKLTSATTSLETQLASKLLKSNAVAKLSTEISSFPSSLFCERKDLGFVGYSTRGVTEKVCDNLFPSPTDVGICMTDNLHTKEVLKDHQPYEILFESEISPSPGKIKEGIYWSQKAYYILLPPSTNIQDDNEEVIDEESNKEDLKMQIHQNADLANMLDGNDFAMDEQTITLLRGHEYFIDVVPVGQTSTINFRNLDKEKRNCLLPNEGPISSVFRQYSQQNCKYECYVSLAKVKCQCNPWEFISAQKFFQVDECDIFGRTCFFAAMKNFSESQTDPCPHCLKACDSFKYQKRVIQSEEFTNSQQTPKSDPILKRFFAMKEYIYDLNNTYFDQGLTMVTSIMASKPKHKMRYENIMKNLIIVHLRILEPEVVLIDAKYSMWDKFANLGGNFGIFAEITGCSFLGTLNLIILSFKLVIPKLFSSCKRIPKLFSNSNRTCRKKK